MKKALFSLLIISCSLQAVHAQPGNDKAQIRNTINDFYNWYAKNYRKLGTDRLYMGIKKKDNPPYKINWTEVERYFTYIRNNVPQLGEEFIRNQRIFFKQCDSAFKVDREDEIPYGFDGDWFTESQEDPSYMLGEIHKAKLWDINVHGNSAIVDIGGHHADSQLLHLEMRKEKGKWTIAKIGSDLGD